MYKRQKVVDLASSWIGKNELDGSHKEIIDIYNEHMPLPRNTKMQYDWAWCACFCSALAIKLRYTEIIPIEISCGDLIENAKKMGCWVENDGYVPKPADFVLYDWNDNGSDDNTGWPDHVGVVDYVNENSGYFTVIEGNYSDSVKKRTVSINGRFIRGFIAPKYDDNAVEPSTPNASGKTIYEIARECIIGIWGNGDERRKLITAAGYNYDVVQAKINEILNTPNVSSDTASDSVVGTTCYASHEDKAIAGSYKTTTGLYLRNDAGKNKKALCLMPEGTIVQNYGFYSIYAGEKWFLVETKVDGTVYVGFCCSTYLTR